MTARPPQPAKQTDILFNKRLFEDVPRGEFDLITAKMDIFTAPAGRLLMQDGDLTSDVFFLLSGTAVGQLVAENGRQILFTDMAAGDHFGELAALDGAARSITISAKSDCTLASLSKPNFHAVMKASPQTCINLATELAARLRSMNERVFSLVMHDVETRVTLRLMQLAQHQEQLVEGGVITNAPTHEAMANFIGSNREAVSRAIAQLNKAGAIETGRKKVVIKSLGKLIETAG